MDVGKEILIYDNQQGYFELLKSNYSDEYQFVLVQDNVAEYVDSEYGMLLFFLYDEIEMLDFARLYKEDIPVVLGLSSLYETRDLEAQGNIHYLHLEKFKKEIIADLDLLLKKVLV